jgi:hypothetical protein
MPPWAGALLIVVLVAVVFSVGGAVVGFILERYMFGGLPA